MLLSLQWLREFTPYEGTAKDLGERLTMLGLEVEALNRPCLDMEETLVGLVRECVRHPDSDHLSVCKVDAGGPEALQIVCGAPNVAVGQYVAVAPEGSSLPGGLKIKKAKLRGVLSQGMICSERELGLSEDHSGILVLQEAMPGRAFTPGRKAAEALGLDLEVLDIGVTPNRPDCLSVLGLARETALAFDLPLKVPSLERDGLEGGEGFGDFALEVENGEISPLYQLRLIRHLTAGPSPAWMRWRLRAVGQRPISNLVDVTNYVMLELGQPLHSFDFDRLRGRLVRVARAAPGERLVTLDGQERKLSPTDITIRDAEGPIALGGVMGGASTAIDGDSRTVLLEGAIFNPAIVRRTSRRLNIFSDAAYRFERGVDQRMTAFALERAALLLAGLGGGKAASVPLSLELKPLAIPRLPLRRARAAALIGIPLEAEFCVSTLRRLGCAVEEEKRKEADWVVTPPSWRPDLEREADLIEELARVYGVDRVPESIPAVPHTLDQAGQPESRHKFLARVKAWAAGAGLNEAVTFSFVGHRELDFLALPRQGRVGIKNPLNADLDVLRPVLAPGLLNALRHNLAQRAAGLRFFEVAAAFSEDPQSPYGTGVREEARLGFLLYGDRYAASWPRSSEDADYLDLKGLVEQFFTCLGLPAPEFVREATGEGAAYLDPAVSLRLNREELGSLGRLRPDLAGSFYAKKEVWLAELLLDKIFALSSKVKASFVPWPVYPPVRRDLTVIAPADLEAGAILAAIHAVRPEYLEEARLWDLYQPEGNTREKHLTWRLTFRHPARTLLDAEVDGIRDKVAKTLVEKLAVRL
ncbi:MAG: phenylalanine--tRNA ligase subunit beta [Desulfovibrionaceae bacterium]|nr:phenylalanine--tRNA ligase subunit beta [Desulfovibrionaceae bacterium]